MKCLFDVIVKTVMNNGHHQKKIANVLTVTQSLFQYIFKIRKNN